MNQAPDAPVSSAAPAPRSKTLRWVLVASLAVNLAVAGMMLGAVLHGGMGGRDMVRDMGFGPYDAALRPQDRDALRALLREKSGDLRATHGEASADVRLILTALRAEPFDLAALDTAFAAQQDHLTARMTLGNQTMRDFLVNLPPQDRKDFADRLEERLMHGRGGRTDEPRD